MGHATTGPGRAGRPVPGPSSLSPLPRTAAGSPSGGTLRVGHATRRGRKKAQRQGSLTVCTHFSSVPSPGTSDKPASAPALAPRSRRKGCSGVPGALAKSAPPASPPGGTRPPELEWGAAGPGVASAWLVGTVSSETQLQGRAHFVLWNPLAPVPIRAPPGASALPHRPTRRAGATRRMGSPPPARQPDRSNYSWNPTRTAADVT